MARNNGATNPPVDAGLAGRWARRCACTVFVLCTACGVVEERDSGPSRPVDLSQVEDAVPRYEPKSRYGNPQSYVVNGHRYHVMNSAAGYVQKGIASWYGTKFHGRRTSSGEAYDMYAMTAAHKNLPLPSYVQVTNLRNGRRVVVRVNDRGPFHDNRLIDLSYVAASRLGIVEEGTGLVEVRAVTPGQPARSTPAPVASVSPPVGIYLQVGAFRDQDNAYRLRTRLASLDSAPVHIIHARTHDALLHRVRLGPLVSVEQADRLVEQLEGLGIHDSQIVVE